MSLATVATLSRRTVQRGAIAAVAATAVMAQAGVSGYEAAVAGSGLDLDAFAANPGLRAFFGTPFDLGTAGGFVAWRLTTPLLAALTVWAVLATSRTRRGDEETGRAELVRAGPVTARGVAAVGLGVLAAAASACGLAAALPLLLAGEPLAGTWRWSAGIVLFTLTAIGVAAVASEVVPQRRRAAGSAGLVLGAAFALRMVADAAEGAAWARWLTPFGWVEELRPFAGDRLAPLVPLVLAPAVLGGLALAVAARRDLGAGLVAADDRAASRTGLLGSPLGFAARRRLRGSAGWAAGITGFGLLMGVVAGTFTDFAEENPGYQDFIERFGLQELLSEAGFLALMASFGALVLGGYAVSWVHAELEDETAGRLEPTLAGAVSRSRWLGALVATTAGGVVALTVLLGVALWAGAELGGARVTLGDALAAPANLLPVLALALGVAVLLHGARPAWATPVAGGGLAVAYLLDLLGPAFGWPERVLDLSPFHHLRAVPAEDPAWGPLVVLVALGVAAGAGGMLAYSRRDLG